jgi:predicted RNA binding protein YcfA (HicA-like mRNA interferase family)
MTRPELRGISARVFMRALEHDGFVWTRTNGSHRTLRHADGRRVVLAFHHLSDTLPAGTLRDLLRHTRWTDTDLRRLGLVSTPPEART